MHHTPHTGHAARGGRSVADRSTAQAGARLVGQSFNTDSRRGPDNATPSPELTLMKFVKARGVNGVARHRATDATPIEGSHESLMSPPTSTPRDMRSPSDNGPGGTRRRRVRGAENRSRVVTPALPSTPPSPPYVSAGGGGGAYTPGYRAPPSPVAMASAATAMMAVNSFLNEPTSGLRRERPMASHRRKFARKNNAAGWSSSSSSGEDAATSPNPHARRGGGGGGGGSGGSGSEEDAMRNLMDEAFKVRDGVCVYVCVCVWRV